MYTNMVPDRFNPYFRKLLHSKTKLSSLQLVQEEVKIGAPKLRASKITKCTSKCDWGGICAQTVETKKTQLD